MTVECRVWNCPLNEAGWCKSIVAVLDENGQCNRAKEKTKKDET